MLKKIQSLRHEVQALGADMAAVRQDADDTERHVSQRAGEIKNRVGQAKDETLAQLSSIDREAQALFDQIASNLGENGWDQELKRQLDEVREGTISLQEFKRTWGDTMVDVGNGQERISQALAQLDPRTFKQKAAEIRDAIREGALELDDVIAQIDASTSGHLGRLKELIKSWQDNRASIQDVIRAAEAARRAVGTDNTAGALTEGLTTLLREAQRSGGYG